VVGEGQQEEAELTIILQKKSSKIWLFYIVIKWLLLYDYFTYLLIYLLIY
jgi:hypothetical protein